MWENLSEDCDGEGGTRNLDFSRLGKNTEFAKRIKNVFTQGIYRKKLKIKGHVIVVAGCDNILDL